MPNEVIFATRCRAKSLSDTGRKEALLGSRVDADRRRFGERLPGHTENPLELKIQAVGLQHRYKEKNMMAHQDKFVVSVQVNGNPLREIRNDSTGENEVFLGDGDQYTLLLKNLHDDRDAVASIEIDGTDVLSGDTLVVPAGGEVRIERFVVDGNLSRGKRFKFVAIDGADGHKVSDPSSRDNGLVVVKFFLAKEGKKIVEHHHHHHHYPAPVIPYHYSGSPGAFFGTTSDASGSVTMDMDDTPLMGAQCCAGGQSVGSSFKGSITRSVGQHVNRTERTKSVPCSKKGATIEGGTSYQQFRNIQIDVEDTPAATIRLRMRAATNKAVTTKEKWHCPDCGVKIKSNDRFCNGCGRKLRWRLGTVSVC